MNPLIYITISLHFQVSNSAMFGGEGSVGYTMVNYGGVKNLETMNDSFVDGQIKLTAAMLNTLPENIKLISKEEYDRETEDEERMEIDVDYEE